MQQYTATLSANRPLVLPRPVRERIARGVTFNVVFTEESSKEYADAQAELLKLVREIKQNPSPDYAIQHPTVQTTPEDVEHLLSMEVGEPLDQEAVDAHWERIEREQEIDELLDEIELLKQMRDDLLSSGH